MTTIVTDIAVIGAGPAGCVFATRMSQLGYEVVLIERAGFPRPRLGESLSPGVMPMLASAGLASGIEAAGFPRVSAISTNWDGTEAVRHDPHAQGMLVDRGRFDAILLDGAKAAGVRVLHPAQAQRTRMADGRWQMAIEMPGGSIHLRARFLADARGRSARASKQRRAMGPRTVAVYAYWTGPRLPDQPRIEAGRDGWYWGVPIPDGSYNTLVFVDADALQGRPMRALDDWLRTRLTDTRLLTNAPGATPGSPARAADATPYIDGDCVSERHIRLGDAALAIDPLSSSGVQKAIQTALSGAIVANTLLRQPELSDAALRFYRDSLEDAASRHQDWAGEHYAVAAGRFSDRFWTARAGEVFPQPIPRAVIGDDEPLALSPDARWEDAPCLGTHFVEMQPALRHPELDGPVAFVAGQALAPLLRGVGPGLTARQLGPPIARWLAGRGILVVASGARRSHGRLAATR